MKPTAAGERKKIRTGGRTVSLGEIVKILNAEVVLNQERSEPGVHTVCSADLMSDVLALSNPDSFLLTGLTAPQVIYTAEMADIKIICFIRGKQPPPETVKLASQKNIILLQSPMAMFDSCGKLYELGLRGCFDQ